MRHGKRTQSTARTKASKPKATDHGDTDEEGDCTDVETEEDKDTQHCFSCGDSFNNDEDCVGCDSCWRWYHYQCVGFDCLPEESEEWYCLICSSQ